MSAHAVSSVSSAGSANPTPAEAVASANNSQGVNSSTSLNSLTDLKEKAPQLYNLMMVGIATNICNDMQHSQDRLKQLMRQGEQQAQG